tara:strand:+ start:5997 stop:6686 length:690 start_codon:yes stop_codon:yes gene_type:complete
MCVRDIEIIRDILESRTTFVFDFDGVLADSLEIKTWAFGEIYKEYGDEIVEKVTNHHTLNGGVSRFDKFKYYHENFLNIHLDDTELDKICNSFSKLVMNAVIECPEIKGAKQFLKKYCVNNKLSFVNSATPQNEIKKIVDRRNMSIYFQSIYGSPKSKYENLKKIFLEYDTTPSQTVFFGDALSDYQAASKSGCEFIGIGSNILNNIKLYEPQKIERCGFLSDFEMILD